MDYFKESSMKRINHDSYSNDGIDTYIGEKGKIPKRITRAKMNKEIVKEIKEERDYGYDTENRHYGE